MAEYIDKEKLIRKLEKWSDVSPKINERNNDFIKILKDEPPADVVERSDIDKAIEDMKFNIKCNTDPETGLVNLLGQGQMMMLYTLKKYLGEE